MLLARLRTLAVLAGLLVPAVAASPAHAASAPAGMFAVGDWAWPSTTTLDREAARGLRSWRVPLDFRSIGSTQGTLQFGGTDTLVSSLATRGITPLFVLTGCPVRDCPTGGPPAAGQALIDWRAFVAAAVRRYGPAGSFWAGHPTLPPRPVGAWQILNEVNGSTQWPSPNAAGYAAFLVATSQSIKAVDPTAKVVLSGLGEKMTIWMKDYLPALYAQPGFRASFDVVAIHGYAVNPADVPKILDTARVVMGANGDATKPLWVTEMSWATGGPAHPFVTTEAGQAANLRASWDTLLSCAPRWNLQRVYWFGWQDRTSAGTDYWGYHNGLNRLDGTAKPALAALDEYTGGGVLPGGRAASCTLPGGMMIDTTTPNTTIATGPGVRTAQTTPTFRFVATESPVRYECHFAGQAWAACPPDANGDWRPTTPLTAGTQTLSVRAIDRQGNADASPATRTTIVDLTPPDTYVAGTWGNVTTHVNTLTLTSNEPVLRYECRVDAGAWATCTSPFTATLANGAHTIGVRAIDLAGHPDAAPATPWYQVRAG